MQSPGPDRALHGLFLHQILGIGQGKAVSERPGTHLARALAAPVKARGLRPDLGTGPLCQFLCRLQTATLKTCLLPIGGLVPALLSQPRGGPRHLKCHMSTRQMLACQLRREQSGREKLGPTCSNALAVNSTSTDLSAWQRTSQTANWPSVLVQLSQFLSRRRRWTFPRSTTMLMPFATDGAADTSVKLTPEQDR